MAKRRNRVNINKKRESLGLKKDLKKADKLANRFLDLSPLDTVDASRSSEIKDLLDQNRALSDPFSASYAGRRTGQLGDFINRYKESTNGYDSSELNALREQRTRGIDRGFQSGRASLARGQNNYRLGATQRAAQLAQLAGQYGTARADANNDLFVQGAAEKQRRLEGYGGVLADTEKQEFDRGQQALANYRSALETARADELAREKVNLGQQAASRATQQGGVLGILGIQEARRNAREQNQLIREGYRSNEAIAGRSQSSGQSSGSSYADQLNKLAEELAAQGGA